MAAAMPRACVLLAALLLAVPSLAQAASLTTYEFPEGRSADDEEAAQAVLKDCLSNVPAWTRLMRARTAGRPDTLAALRRASAAAAPCVAAYGATAVKTDVDVAASGDTSGALRPYVAQSALTRTLMLQGLLRLAPEKNLGILKYVQGRFSALNVEVGGGCAAKVNTTLAALTNPLVVLDPAGAAEKLAALALTDPACANKRAEVTVLLLIFGSLFCPGSGLCTNFSTGYIDKPTDYEARSGALMGAAVVSRFVDRGSKDDLARLGRSFFRLALAASHTTSYATCSSLLTAKLITPATIIPTGSPDSPTGTSLYSADAVSASGITLACDTINILSSYAGAGAWKPNLLIQGVTDMVNALALKLDTGDVQTWCKRLHCMTRFYYNTGATSGAVADFLNEARCVMDQSTCSPTTLRPAWMAQEPGLAVGHDFTYNPTGAFKCTNSTAPCAA